MSVELIESLAKQLAKENREAEPEITRIYRFPDDTQIRLVEILPSMPASPDKKLHPYFFRPAPEDGFPSPSGIALIAPEEELVVSLPEKWGDWKSAKVLED